MTLVLDGAPFIFQHLPIYEASGLDFTWHVCEGAAANTGSTRWCKPQNPRLSRDGTAEYLNSLARHPNVKIYRKQMWPGGKDEMARVPLSKINEECVLLQADSDEIWTAENLKKIVSLFEARHDLDAMTFQCRYFLARDIVVNIENELRHGKFHWTRAWRFKPGVNWKSHEPPVLTMQPRAELSAHETFALGLIFDHFSYVTEAQVAYKQKFYNYPNAVTLWRRLQANTIWPIHVRQFLPWSNPHSICERIKL
jgi:hypothetical protein